MASKWYYKEQFSNYFIVEGAPVQFEQLDGNRGVLVLDTEKDAKLIEALDKAAAAGRGGIVRINEKQYEDKKKQALPKRPDEPLTRLSNEIRVMPRDLSPQQTAKAAGEGNGSGKDPNVDAYGLPLYDKNKLRLDGPTLEEYVARGYSAEGYPPYGYAVRTVPRWKEAGLPGPPSEPTPVSLPKADSEVKKEQGQGTEAAAETAKAAAPPAPAFKPATRRLGAEKSEKDKEKEKQPEKPTPPPPETQT